MLAIKLHTGLEGYLLLFGWVFAEQIGLPLPATPTLLAAGALAAAGRLNLALLIGTALSASLFADYLWYRVGIFRRGAINRFKRRHPDSRMLRNAERLIARYGSRSLLFAKFVPGVSLAAPPLNGAGGVKLSEFLLFDALGSLIWSVGLMGIGYLSGRTLKSGSIPLSTSACLLLCAAMAIALAGVRFAHRIWKKLRERLLTAAVARRVIRIHTQAPARLEWLISLITGDAVSEPDNAPESVLLNQTANPSFAQWIAAWPRKLAIARAVGRVVVELKDSAHRMELFDRTQLRSVLQLDWRRLCSLSQAQLERGIAAIDLFPRCALILTGFEKMPLEDAAILLGARREVVANAQAIGLAQLSKSLAGVQGWATELRVPSQPALETLTQKA